MKFGDDHKAKEQGQRDAAYALAAALAAEKSATWAHVEATVAYYASTKTRKKTAPRVKARYSKKVWGNNDNHNKVEVDITTKKDLSNSYLAEEAEVLIQVREAVQKLARAPSWR